MQEIIYGKELDHRPPNLIIGPSTSGTENKYRDNNFRIMKEAKKSDRAIYTTNDGHVYTPFH